jgi:hypothetical protein
VEPNQAVVAELRALGLIDEGDDEVELYHATSVENAKQIKESGAMKADCNGVVYLSTSPEIVVVHSTGRDDISALLKVRVPVASLEVSRDWRPNGDARIDLIGLSRGPGADYLVSVVECKQYERT